MSTTDKYDWDLTDYGTSGWNGIIKSLTQDLDDKLQTYILGTVGESVVADDILYLKSDGKYWKAKAAAGMVPARGIALEAGSADDEIKIRRIGPYTPASQATLTIGGKVYVDATTAGAWTQTKPDAFAQAVGMALSATVIFVWIEDLIEIHYGTADPPTPTDYPDGTIYLKHES